MMTLKLAGLRVRIAPGSEALRAFCRDYITAEPGSADIEVRVSAEEIRRRRADGPSLYPDDAAAERALVCARIADALPEFDAFLLHAAAVAVDGQAYAFAARSGVGKSTHIAYWRQVLGERMRVINGDKPICRFTAEGRLTVFGSPWRGKEGWGENICAPLRALCLVERGAENEVIPLPADRVPRELFDQLHWAGLGAEGWLRTLRLTERLAQGVPLWRLRCRNDVSAAENAIQILTEGGDEE